MAEQVQPGDVSSPKKTPPEGAHHHARASQEFVGEGAGCARHCAEQRLNYAPQKAKGPGWALRKARAPRCALPRRRAPGCALPQGRVLGSALKASVPERACAQVRVCIDGRASSLGSRLRCTEGGNMGTPLASMASWQTGLKREKCVCNCFFFCCCLLPAAACCRPRQHVNLQLFEVRCHMCAVQNEGDMYSWEARHWQRRKECITSNKPVRAGKKTWCSHSCGGTTPVEKGV